MKNYWFAFVLLYCCIACKEQKNTTTTSVKTSYISPPKLVVGIVVDQMRYDYLPRFWDKYGEGGFKRMVSEGFNCKNNHFNYIPTYTGPGHASIYTGTTPANHGIIGNNWYDKKRDTMLYCTEDNTVASIGTIHKAGKMSPRNMKTSTITDQLRLATQLQGKVIGISLKDRGAILPAGHAANAAYWFHGLDEGIWISSSYYMDALPQWVVDFNTSNTAESYKKPWNTLYDISTYTESGTDNNTFEGKFRGEEAPIFPHNFDTLWDRNGKFNSIKTSPFGNNITTDFAIAALDGEQLGSDEITDFLAVSYSSTDYVGHMYGVNSKEVQDTYIRLDKDLERLFGTLDEKVGKGNYTVFLTADHGAVHVPAYLQSVKIPGGYFSISDFKATLNTFLKRRFKTEKIVKKMANYQLFLDLELLEERDLEIDDVEEIIAQEILKYNGIAEVYTGTAMKTQNYTQSTASLLQKGYSQKRSGDLLIVLDPAVIAYSKTGSTHGSGFTYDTHAPLLFYGKGIQKGATTARTAITDIAPTISSLLGIAYPNGATGNPITEAIR